MRLNIGQVLHYLTPYFNKKQGDEFIFQCPYCMDTGRDNLKFNERKGILHCFANPEHSKMIYKKIMSNPKLRRLSQPTQYEYQDDRNSLSYEEQIGYMLGFDTCNDYLLENEELLNLLYQKRGINKETVYNMNIGFEPHLNKWVFLIMAIERVTVWRYWVMNFVRKIFLRKVCVALKVHPIIFLQ